jgi:biopolymer transport protein ExbD
MKFHTRRRVSPVITIVSLVDILTMVLMFFVYTTTFKTNQPQVVIDLPKVSQQGEKVSDKSTTILSVSKEGTVYLGEKEVSLADLGEAVKKLQGDNQQFAMKADEKAPFGTIMTVLDTLKTAGVPNLPAFTRDK